MQLSERLLAVSALVSDGSRLADVGTDHGYIPIYLCEKKKIPFAIAMDVNKGPLLRAKEHIEAYGMEDRIKTRLSDGLQKLHAGEVDSVAIAGMGGGLVCRILSQGQEKLSTVKELILQPQSEIDQVRRYLQEHGWNIEKEDIVFEDGKYYPMMKALKGTSPAYTETELAYGPLLLKERHPVLVQYLEKEAVNFTTIIEKLKTQDSERSRDRQKELKADWMRNKEARSRYDDL